MKESVRDDDDALRMRAAAADWRVFLRFWDFAAATRAPSSPTTDPISSTALVFVRDPFVLPWIPPLPSTAR